jgi:chaperonin GroES|uniref:Co-chaperonin GroES n=1 Tax=uncultured virus TaxID=340016 RepID=A0A221S3M5_9VIRU|nr:co-chaperonin GroES [uncultured virus]
MTDSVKVDLSAASAAIAEMAANAPQGEVSNLADVYTHQKPRLNPEIIGASLLDRMPAPTGWRILILPYRGKEKTAGGIFIPDEVQEKSNISTQVGYVLKVGPLAYKDTSKFPDGPWCREKQWVMFARYAGSRFQIDGGEVRILNDDEILATILDPEDIHHL